MNNNSTNKTNLIIKTNIEHKIEWYCFDSNNINQYKHGTGWKESDCQYCFCNNGERICNDITDKCPKINCERPVIKKGECCLHCLDLNDSPYLLDDKIIDNDIFSGSNKYIFFFTVLYNK